LFAGAVLFSLLTLPAELNASSRALTYFASPLTNCASFLRLLLLRKKKR
jgi:Zn-dependent membrane protease YugP